MRLSYLDILLSTTAIFVVLFGVLSVSESLPEIEGKSLTMLIAVERPQGKPLSVEVEYLDLHGRTLGKLPGTGPHPKIMEYYQLKIDDSRVADGIVVIRGQPELKSTLRVSARVKIDLDEYQAVLLDLGKVDLQTKLDSSDRALLDWIRRGEDMAFSPTTAPASRPQVLEAWAAACPAGRTGTLWEELERLANDRNVQATKRSRIDLLAYALIVHDGIMPRIERKIPAERPASRPMRETFFRARRHVERSWGETIPLLQLVPAWCKERVLPTDDTDLPPNRRANVRRADWADTWVRFTPDGGTFFIEDCISTDVLRPFRGFWSYAGNNGCRASTWKHDPGEPGTLVAEWVASFD